MEHRRPAAAQRPFGAVDRLRWQQNRYQNDYREINLPDESYLAGAASAARNYNTAPGLPYPGFHSINLSTNEANSHYNGLQIDLSSQVGRDLTLRAYLHAVAHDRSDQRGNGGGDLGNMSNPYAGWKYDVGPGGYDRTHNASVNFIYDIPFLRTTSENRFLKATLGGWEVSGIVTHHFRIADQSAAHRRTERQRPAQRHQPSRPGCGTSRYPHTVGEWFSTSAFAAPALGAFGDAGHNSLRGPGRDNWNLSLFKSFVLSETRGSRFELRVETFNTWNHTEFNQVSNGLGSSNFGQVTSAFDPRVFQLGAKLYF